MLGRGVISTPLPFITKANLNKRLTVAVKDAAWFSGEYALKSK
jgi:hypothetical protein